MARRPTGDDLQQSIRDCDPIAHKDGPAAGEQLEFERLITETAARLAQVQPENIDAEIQETLSLLGRFLATERAFIFQFTEDGESLKSTHVWADEGFSPQSEIFELDLASNIPWVARQIRSGREIIVGPGHAGLPDEAQELRQQLERDGINSGFVVPIIVEGSSIGMFGLDTVDKAREYPAPVMERMRVLGDMIGSTLQRVRVQKKLEQYRHIVESTMSIIGLVDRNYVYQYVNNGYCAAFQKDRHEIIGSAVADLLGKEKFEQTLKAHYDRCFGGEEVTFQAWAEFAGWGDRFMDVRYSPFVGDDGKVSAVVVSAHDITGIKLLELKLAESEERFRVFMDNIPAVVYIKDEEDRHIYTNPEGYVSMGKKPDEFIGATTRDLWPPELADELIALDKKVIDEGAPRIVEEWQSPEVGDAEWRRDIKFPIQLESGKKLLGGIAIDITELKRAEADIKEQMAFEQLLTRLSITFINVPSENIDRIIDDALEQIGRFFDLDRCSFGNLTSDKKKMQVTHVWNRKKIAATRMSYPLDRYPWLLSPFVTGKPLTWSRAEGLPPGSEDDIRLLEDSGMQSFAGIPVKVSGEPSGCLGFSDTTHARIWDQQLTERFPVVAAMFGHLIARRQADTKLRKAFSEIKSLQSRLETENIYLREEIKLRHQHEEIIGKSKPVLEMLANAEKVAETDAMVLVLGETGTGKELLANAIHRLSRRKDRTMIKVNCAALPATLIESELFGREKGAYTGAMSRQIGRFEIADGSTLFLDEIGELPLELQAKLLRVLQEGQFERLGSPQTVSTDVRIITSTNRDLAKAIQEGRFREDLFYRLNVFSVTVPPLRDRTEDIPALVWAFVKEYESAMGKAIHQIPKNSIEALQNYAWPGNIRELKNVVENAMIVSTGKTLHINPPLDPSAIVQKSVKLEDVERDHIKEVLKKTRWRVSGKNGAAEQLGLKPTTLESRMKKLGISRPV